VALWRNSDVVRPGLASIAHVGKGSPGMRNGVFALVVAVSGLSGQAASEVWKPGRDLEGLWTNASLTTLERPPAFKALVVPRL